MGWVLSFPLLGHRMFIATRPYSSRRSALLRQGLRLVWRHTSSKAAQNQSCCGVAAAGVGVNTGGRERAPLFDMETSAAASRLRNSPSARRITEELVDGKVLLEGAYSADQRSAVRWIEDQTPSHWSDGASLTVVLLLSLGVWAGVWEAIASLASAVLQ
jgi:hypothetical protein